MTDPAELAKELYAIAGDAWAQANPAAGVVINKAAAMLDQLASLQSQVATLTAERDEARSGYLRAAETAHQLRNMVDQAHVAYDSERAMGREERQRLLDQLASTMSAEEVREAAAKIAEASGNTPRTIASLIRAMPLTK